MCPRFCRRKVAEIDRRSSEERMTQRARTTAKRERCDSPRAQKEERERKRRKPPHGSAFCLVNLFFFSPPETRSYLRGLRVPPNFGFTRGVVKNPNGRVIYGRFRVRGRPNVYPRRSRLKNPAWKVSALRVDLRNLRRGDKYRRRCNT